MIAALRAGPLHEMSSLIEANLASDHLEIRPAACAEELLIQAALARLDLLQEKYDFTLVCFNYTTTDESVYNLLGNFTAPGDEEEGFSPSSFEPNFFSLTTSRAIVSLAKERINKGTQLNNLLSRLARGLSHHSR